MLCGFFLANWSEFVHLLQFESGYFTNCKTTPPSKEANQSPNAPNEVLICLVNDPKVCEHRGYQLPADRSLKDNVLETTIQTPKEPLYMVFLCNSSFLFSSMVFILYLIRWYRRSFPL